MANESAVLEKIANLVLNGVPQVQIAASCGVTESRISQVVATDEYKAVEQRLAVQYTEQQQIINGGWDAIEEHALTHVLKAMQANPDPEFALKTAAIANRATRRGAINQQPGVGSAGVRAVINLNATFVEQLQQNFSIADTRGSRPRDQKRVNMMSVADVENALTVRSPQAQAQPLIELPEMDFRG